jgi:hypothetical protein
VVWRKVQVARPSDSTSGGQYGGRGSPSPAADAANAVAVAEAIACAIELPSPLLSRLDVAAAAAVVVGFWPVVGGFQFRKEVQILQGLPSGPRTVPGGSGRRAPEEDDDCAVELLVLVLILTPLQL